MTFFLRKEPVVLLSLAAAERFAENPRAPEFARLNETLAENGASLSPRIEGEFVGGFFGNMFNLVAVSGGELGRRQAAKALKALNAPALRPAVVAEAYEKKKAMLAL